jgi:hypothetical protein
MHAPRVPLAALALVGAVTLAGAPRSAAAQIVNVVGSLAAEPAPGWSGQLAATADWRTGNTDLVLIGGSATALHRRSRVLALGIVRGEYGEGNGTPLSRKSFEHLRVRVALDAPTPVPGAGAPPPRWLWEAFAQHEYDRFRRLSVRALAGTGPAVRLVRRARGALVLGVAYLLEYERLDERPGVADPGATSLAHRASSYLTGNVALDARLTATATAYAQPRLDDPADLRLLAEATLSSKLSGRVTLTQRLTLARDASPPDGIERTDSTLKLEVGLAL